MAWRLLLLRRSLPEEQGGAADAPHDRGPVVHREAIDGALARVAIVGSDADLDQLVVDQGTLQRRSDPCGDTRLADGYDDRQLVAAAAQLGSMIA